MSRWFAAPLTTLAFCWRLDRLDGVTLGLTSHDRDVWFDALRYRAAPGLVPSALDRSATLEPDTIELTGALTSHLLRPDDLALGRWDGARLQLWAINWESPDDDPLRLAAGQLGAVTLEGTRFQVELNGRAAALDRDATETTSPYCRAQLGDTRCRVPMAGRVLLAQLVGQDGARLMIDQPVMPGEYAFGRLRWLDGPRAGLTEMILENDTRAVTLIDVGDADVVGRRVELTQGCDRRFATCTSRFANGANFRGEPHMPGNDLLVRYGG